jgi:hypothetical protein
MRTGVYLFLLRIIWDLIPINQDSYAKYQALSTANQNDGLLVSEVAFVCNFSNM